MKNILITLFLIFLFSSCKSENKNILSDLNLYFESKVDIDSIFISNISQDREFQFLTYSNNLNINFNDSINDLYNINFYTKDGLLMNQMWLNGKNIKITGTVSKSVKIDTVIGSDLYYKSIDFKLKYRKLLDSFSEDSTKINMFLINELKKNIDNPFSINIAEKFLSRNLNNNSELKKVFSLLSTQNNMLREHLLSPYSKIEKLLFVKKIDFSKYKFYNKEKDLSKIKLIEEKLYLIDFWFVNCPPCIKDHIRIKNRLDWLKENNIELIGISTDTDQNKWIDYLEKGKYEWKNYIELEDYDQRITTTMLINTFPTYLLIDDQGIIKIRANSFSDIEKYLGE